MDLRNLSLRFVVEFSMFFSIVEINVIKAAQSSSLFGYRIFYRVVKKL